MMAIHSPPKAAVSTRTLSRCLLFFYVVVAFSLRNHQMFDDEGAALDLGSCVLKGLTLYRDIFHHHLPLPVYIAAFVTHFAGISIPSIRLFMFLLGTGVFTCLVFLSRASFPVAFAAALWALVSPYYFGNMLLYDNLAMLGGMVLGVLSFSAVARGMEASTSMFVMLALAGVVASLSNPFFIVVTFIATSALFLAPQIPRAFILRLWMMIAGSLGVFVLYLVLTDSLKAFYTDVVVFNLTFYQHYAPLNLAGALRHQVFLLNLFNSDWYHSLHPFQFNPSTLTPTFDNWLFSGVFYRAASLGACLIFALRRDYKTTVFLYAFLVALPLRGDSGFHAAPFVVFSLFLAGVVIEECLSMAKPSRHLILVLCSAPALFLALSGGRYVVKHAFESNTFIYLAEAQFIRESAQGRKDVKLGHFPAGDYMYYLTDLLPVSRFVYFYPWVADFGREQLDRDLEREAASANIVLVLDSGGSFFYRPNSNTLNTELLFAKQRLVKENISWLVAYVSPAISLSPGSSPPSQPVPMPESSSAGSQPGIYRAGKWLLGSDSGAVVHGFGGNPDDIPVTGDWDGTGKTKLGLYRVHTGRWLLDINGNRSVDPGEDIYHFGGAPGDVPVTGDWNGTGKSKVGIYRPSTGEWLLDFDGDGVFNPARDKQYIFGGNASDVPVVGDWTGSGKTKVGVFRGGHQWLLDLDGNGQFEIGRDADFSFGGITGDVPVSGDWNGNGKSKPGIFRQGFLWVLDFNDNYDNIRGTHIADRVFGFGGLPGDKPVTGRW